MPMNPLLLAAMLLGPMLASTAQTRPPRPTNPRPAAYLCQSTNSYAYHRTTRCDGLAWCTRDITKTTEAQAKKLGRYQCGRCH